MCPSFSCFLVDMASTHSSIPECFACSCSFLCYFLTTFTHTGLYWQHMNEIIIKFNVLLQFLPETFNLFQHSTPKSQNSI